MCGQMGVYSGKGLLHLPTYNVVRTEEQCQSPSPAKIAASTKRPAHRARTPATTAARTTNGHPSMRILVESDSDELHEQLRADSRGRITLGSDYAGETVSVAVIDRDAENDRKEEN